MQSVNVSLLCRRTKFHCLFGKSFVLTKCCRSKSSAVSASKSQMDTKEKEGGEVHGSRRGFENRS